MAPHTRLMAVACVLCLAIPPSAAAWFYDDSYGDYYYRELYLDDFGPYGGAGPYEWGEDPMANCHSSLVSTGKGGEGGQQEVAV